MMRWIASIAFAVVVTAGTTSSSAATVSFLVTGQPTLTALGFTWSVGGSASLDTSGPLPVVNMPVTLFNPFGGAPVNGRYDLVTSTVTATSGGVLLEFSQFIMSINDFVGERGFLQADLKVTNSGSVSLLNNFVFGSLQNDTLDLVFNPQMLALLATNGIRGLDGVIAQVSLPTPIPLPGTLPLVVGALGLIAAVARRGRAATR